jgi:hypothetical protein
MPGSDEVERKIREMLVEMGDGRLLAEFEGAIKASDERNQRIDEALEELLHELDRLLLKVDELDAASLESEEEFEEESEKEICIR